MAICKIEQYLTIFHLPPQNEVDHDVLENAAVKGWSLMKIDDSRDFLCTNIDDTEEEFKDLAKELPLVYQNNTTTISLVTK